MAVFKHKLLLCPKMRLDALGLHYSFQFAYTPSFHFLPMGVQTQEVLQTWSQSGLVQPSKAALPFLQIRMKW